MMNYLDIWRAIDKLAQKHGFTPSGLARRAGLNPTTFNPGKRIGPDGKPRWPNTESIAKILDVTETSMTEFATLIQKSDNDDYALPVSVPLIGFAEAAQEGYFDEAGVPVGGGWDEIHLPNLHNPNTYALEVSGHAMEPLYREGDILVVSPSTPLRRGDRVVIKTGKGDIMAQELVRMSAQKLDVKALNGSNADSSFQMKDVTWVARIMWVSQ